MYQSLLYSYLIQLTFTDVHTYLCKHTLTYTHLVQTVLYTFTCTHTHTHTHTHRHTHTHTHTHTNTHTHTHTAPAEIIPVITRGSGSQITIDWTSSVAGADRVLRYIVDVREYISGLIKTQSVSGYPRELPVSQLHHTPTALS